MNKFYQKEKLKKVMFNGRKWDYETFFEVFEALEESGYNPVNQITGYLVTGDAGYITNYKRAREKIMNIEKVKLISILVENYFLK